MKLKELLMLLYDAGQFNNDGIMNSDSLKRVKHHIMTCDEFKDTKELVFVKLPIWKDPVNGKSYQAKQYKLTDDLKFGHTVHLQSISITPEMYDPYCWLGDKLDGSAIITPIIYNPETFEAKRHIVIEYDARNENFTDTEKLNLLERLKRVLDNPNDYRIKGRRDFIIRGLIN